MSLFYSPEGIQVKAPVSNALPRLPLHWARSSTLHRISERLWRACVLYVVRRLSAGASGGEDRHENGLPRFTFSQLLLETKLSAVEFFKEIPRFLAKAGFSLKSLYGEDWEKRLQVKEAQTNFVHMMVFYK